VRLQPTGNDVSTEAKDNVGIRCQATRGDDKLRRRIMCCIEL
jgi:hypothetical protein